LRKTGITRPIPVATVELPVPSGVMFAYVTGATWNAPIVSVSNENPVVGSLTGLAPPVFSVCAVVSSWRSQENVAVPSWSHAGRVRAGAA
jgi:hypothetical protein